LGWPCLASFKREIVAKPIKFAVIGCGHIGKRHATIIQENQECDLVALCDIKPKKDLAIEQFDIPFYSSLEELIRTKPKLDVVCICTPNGLHAQQSIQCLDAGWHIVCEKPMALNRMDCETIIHKALNVSRQVFCVMQNRYSSPSVWVKELIEEKRLGDILMVQVNCYWNRDDRYYYLHGGQAHTWHGNKDLDGGTLFTQFSHFVDTLYWLLGDIKNIKARFADFTHQESTDFEDSGIVQFDFVNGGMGCINYSTAVWNANFESSLTILGTKGTIKIGGQYMNEVEHCHIQDYEMPTLEPVNPPNDYGPYKGSAANHHFVIENVVDVLRNGQNIKTNAMEGLKVVDIIERIYNLKKDKNRIAFS